LSITQAKGNQDGYCENKAVVRRTIAALCAYDEQALGRLLPARLREENGVNPAAENLVRYWMERRVPFRDGLVLRLLFVFEMLVCAFDFRQEMQSKAHLPHPISQAPTQQGYTDDQSHLCTWGWDDTDELKGSKEALDWWMGKCGFCAGRGLRGSRIEHTMEACIKGGKKQDRIPPLQNHVA
jgi:hypothetical protein